jgi:outer membrane protein assembly factor BamB
VTARARLVLVALLAAAPGWRGDGTGVARGTPPLAWTANDASCWRVPLERPTNGSPVLADGRLYLPIEPDGLAAFDAASGRRLWTARLDVTRAFDPATAAELTRRLAAVSDDQRALADLRTRYAQLQRDARRTDAPPDVIERLRTAGAEIASLQARIDAMTPYTTTRDLGWIGYASATPLVADGRVFAIAGHGVLGAFDRDGNPLWTRWLGRPTEPMRGWVAGHAASPVLAGGVLVVAFGRLRGLDPATGRELWAGTTPWDHFGSPATVIVGDHAHVVTPGGEVVRARDGRVVASGLGAVFHAGPVVQGDVVVIQGNTSNRGRGGLSTGHRLVAEGDGVRAERLWWSDVADMRNVASGPVLHGGGVYSFELETGRTWRVDQATGAVRVFDAPTGSDETGGFYGSPVLVGDHVFLPAEGGAVRVVRLSPEGPTIVGDHPAPTSRATPWIEGRRLYVRGLEELRCYAAR